MFFFPSREVDAEPVASRIILVRSFCVEGKEIILEFIVDMYAAECVLRPCNRQWRLQDHQERKDLKEAQWEEQSHEASIFSVKLESPGSQKTNLRQLAFK
jgi:hypothetical protein